MEVSDWLVIVLLIAIVVVLLDGVRRKLRERRDRVVVKLDRNIPAVEADEDVVALAELPNGGARTLPRNDKPAPTLRNLKSTRKPLSDKPQRPAKPPRREPAADSNARPVPVLMDAVEVEEERIEHTHVFADSSRPADFLADDYEDAGAAFRASLADGDNDDEEEEDAAMPAVQPVARHRQGADTRYHGDDDEDDFDEEEFEDEDEEEFDDEDEEFDDDDEDELPVPGVTRARDEDDDDDDFDDDDEEFDDNNEEDDEELDEDDDEEEDDEEDDDEEDDDLDELGFPDDNFGSEEEMDQLVADDYENEPVLLESTYGKAASHFNRPSRQPRREPGFGNDSFDESEFDEDFSAARTATGDDQQGEAIRPVPLTPRPAPAQAESFVEDSGQQNPRDKAAPGKEDQVDLFREVPPAAIRSEPRAASAKPGKPQPVAEPAPAPGPQEVIIINVMARPGQTLVGYELLPVLQQQGLRLGEMSIFHRHAEQNGNGPVIFSMANMVKPGTFELAAMEDFTTPGVSFFLQIPNKLGNMQAFELMLGAATAVRNALDGELKDENRSVFTRQTVEHCRQSIRDFELKLLSRKN